MTEELCHICGVVMTTEEGIHQNCGGDCLTCMAETGDPDCIEKLNRIKGIARGVRLMMEHSRYGK